MTLSDDQKRELVIQGDPEQALRDALNRPEWQYVKEFQNGWGNAGRDTGDECGCDAC